MAVEIYIYDCYVISIGRKYFWARITDIGDEYPYYEGQFPISKVTKRDKNVFRVGAIFTCTVRGKRNSLKFSHRRYTQDELDQSHRNAEKLSKIIQALAE